ncbi:MAG: ABC transporter permease subunit [Gammaproteobacteria bacterium]|nr:ABC transporter permease subunit [Gammaproteobacteria bacterium]
MRRFFSIDYLAALLASILILPSASAAEKVIASKNFTENIILAEIATQILDSSGIVVRHEVNLGGSRILWTALLTGEIAAYPEYTGTLSAEMLAGKKIESDLELRAALEDLGIGMTERIGFNNTYVMGMLEQVAESLNISRISDLQRHPDLAFAFSNEFMDRDDGWTGLRTRYQLPQSNVRGLDHDLAYRGLESKSIDVIDLYSTDAEIEYYRIRSLEDDRNYFPDYYGVYIYRLDEDPALVEGLHRMTGKIDDQLMVTLNAAVKLEGRSEPEVAADFVKQKFSIESDIVERSLFQRFVENTRQHLILVLISLSAAICVAIPLGVVAARLPRCGQIILGISGVLQTIPSLALFVFLIPVLGIGGPPTVVALFIYSLLPIIRNTYSGLHDIPAAIRESALVIGLPAGASLRLVELPLATRSILAGIKTSAVINIGTATLGALIGAGGYGQPILTGIRLDDIGLILEGAIPAAILALLVQGIFEFIERVLLPAPMRFAQTGQRND